MELADLQLLSESNYDYKLIEGIGAVAINEAIIFGVMDEAFKVQFGAAQSIKHLFSQELKDAKRELADAESAISKGDKAKAKKHIDAAQKALKTGRSKAEEIDDDGVIESLIISSAIGLFGPIGNLAYTVGLYYSWFCLREQSDKGDVYSKVKPDRRKNLALEFFFTKYRRAGYSRSAVLAGYDRLIGELDSIKSRVDRM